MKIEKVPELPNQPTAQELTLWTRNLATMLSIGVSLARCLQVLEDEPTGGAMQDVTRQLRAIVLERGETLSYAMGTVAQVFESDYIRSVWVGEIGGVLDVTMVRQAEILEGGLAPARPPEGEEVPRVELAQWCWRLAHMLSAGVSILHALATLGDPLPGPLLEATPHDLCRRRQPRTGPPGGKARVIVQKTGKGGLAFGSGCSPLEEITLELRDQMRAGSGLVEPVMRWYPDLFTPLVRQIIAVGEGTGEVSQMLSRAAELLEQQAHLEAQGKLPPLLARRAEDAPELRRAQTPESDYPVIRRVNEVITAALRAEAEWILFTPAAEDKGQASLQKSGQTVETIPLDDYDRVARRVKVMASIDPFARQEQRGRIHIRWEGKEFEASVYSRPQASGEHLQVHLQPTKGIEVSEGEPQA